MISGTRSLIGVAFLTLALPSPGQDFDLSILMQRMAEVPASTASFVETRHLALLTRPIELKGRLSYERPHRLSKHVLSPFDELTSVDGDALSVLNRTKGESRQFSLREQPALGALVEGLRAALAGDQARLERHYRVEFSGARDSWRLQLAPREARVRTYVETIALSGAGTRVTRVEIVETGGDRSVMTLVHDRN